MIESINLPLYGAVRDEYGGWDGVEADCRALSCQGVEGIWSGAEEIPTDFPDRLLTGYHLTFFPDFLDFYRGDRKRLIEKFGSMEAVSAFYGSTSPDFLLETYRRDLARAELLGAAYVVFHVSDVSVEEGYTYRWLHSDEEVIDASLELINALLRGRAPTFRFLVENQWWPGFRFTEPEKTERLLSGISYGSVGIMLDTGHLMNCNRDLETQAQGVRYLRQMAALHGDLKRAVCGLHLHQSLSGAYVRTHTGALPDPLSGTYLERFADSYAHILQIDRHQPWTDPAIGAFLEELQPQFLTHELSAANRAARFQAVRTQRAACGL